MNAIVKHVLEFVETNWDTVGIDIPHDDQGLFNVPDAIEVAVNELLDHARDMGYSVKHQGEDIGVMGVCVREEIE